MKNNELNAILEGVLKGTEVAMAAQGLTALSTVRAMVPGTVGQEAKIEALNELLDLVLTGVQLVQNVVDEDGEAIHMAELGEAFNLRLELVNKRIDALLALSDDEYAAAIPEERQKSLLSRLEAVKAEEAVMERFSKSHAAMLKEQKKRPGSRILEPIPGVLMLQARKDPWDVIGRSPEVEYIES